jgi:hypothetical protein
MAMSTQAFHPGSVVLLTLAEPRQKFFGLLLELESKGVVLRGIHLESLEDLARMVHAGEQANASTLFFPMHRVERMELDCADGELPSLADNFAAQSGHSVEDIFGPVPQS